MAVVFNQNNKDKDNNQDQQDQGTAPQQTNPGVVGDIGASGQAAASTAAPTQAGGGTSSGRFTNISNYLNANKNYNQQGGGLAGKVANNLTNQGQQVKQNVQGAFNTFQTKANEQVDKSKAAVPLVQQAVADPNAFVQNQANLNTVTNARDAQYTGPKTLQDLQGDQNQAVLQSKAQNFGTAVNQGQTETGRFNLLRTMFGRPNYSSGQQNLDNLLIQGNKDQLAKIQGTRKVSADVNRDLTQNIQQAQNVGQQSQVQVNDIKNQTRDLLNNRVLTEQQAIDKQLADAKVAQQKGYEDFVNNLKQGQVSRADAAKFNLSEGTNLYNLDPTSLVQKTMDPNAEVVATKQNYDQIAALRQLLGSAQGEQASKVLSGYQDPSKAGSFKDYYNLDTDRFNDQVAQQQRDYLAATQSNRDQLKEAEGTIPDVTANYNNMTDTYKNALNNILSGGFASTNGGTNVSAYDKQAAALNQILQASGQQTINANYQQTAQQQQLLNAAKAALPGLNNDQILSLSPELSKLLGVGNATDSSAADRYHFEMNKAAQQRAELERLANQYNANKKLKFLD